MIIIVKDQQHQRNAYCHQIGKRFHHLANAVSVNYE